MDRRNFLKMAASTVLLPHITPASHPDETSSYRLWATLVPSNNPWHKGQQDLIVGKGPYTARSYNGISDLRDCHGLCATTEAMYIVVQQLEYGDEILRKLYEFPWNEVEERILQEPKRINVTRGERINLHKLMQLWRGEHDCVYKYRGV